MDDTRIESLADFFYGSDNASSVPLRIMASTGAFSGFDFDKEGLIALLYILRDSIDLKKDLSVFREEYGD